MSARIADEWPLVSAIIPVFNVEAYVGEALESLAEQTYPNLEILAVDDGSTDNSMNVVRAAARLNNRIRILTTGGNLGLSVARNVGLHGALGQYILFVDSDDLIDRAAILHAAKAALRLKADVVQYRYRVFHDEAPRTRAGGRIDEETSKSRLISRSEFLGLPYFSWAKLIRRRLLDEAQLEFQPGQLYEDHVFHWMVGLTAQRHVLLDESLYWYRLRQGAITSRMDLSLLDQVTAYELIAEALSQQKASDLMPLHARRMAESCWYILSNIDKPHLEDAWLRVLATGGLPSLTRESPLHLRMLVDATASGSMFYWRAFRLLRSCRDLLRAASAVRRVRPSQDGVRNAGAMQGLPEAYGRGRSDRMAGK